ncbi:MAG: hypothetical protein FVQ85_11145 [Planctomycetes bacterium]|nr:hypothetical protein [Planctomycetota bacterium]
MKKQLPLKDIRTDGKTQQRPVDDTVVARYAAMMKDGCVFPPVEIITDGKSNFLWDGAHRYFAHLKRDKKYIEVNIKEGTQRDAIYLSFSANKTNAFPRQPGTAKEIIKKILKDSEWSKMSQHDIARHVGCTQQYVHKIVKEIDEAIQQPGCQIESGSEPENKVLPRPKAVKVKRGDAEYEMQVPEKKVLDSKGKQVPEHLVKYFERSNEYRQMIRELNVMLKTVRDGKDAGDLFYRFIKIENLTAEIGNVKRIFRFALPYAVCPYCGADENNAECRACEGCGFVNELTYRATPEDLK